MGNVLPASDHPNKEGDDTFDFNLDESKNISLKDIPIRIEHEEGLAVGQVARDWTDNDGKKWILGRGNDDMLESRYAVYAIKPSSTGHTLYKGLSLQHVHTSFSDGSTSKRAIEVSLCTEPRRPGCEVTCVDQSKKMEYIKHLASGKNMSTNRLPLSMKPLPLSRPPLLSLLPRPPLLRKVLPRRPRVQKSLQADRSGERAWIHQGLL